MRDRDRRYIGYDYLDGDCVYGEDICNVGYEDELWFYTGYPDIMVSDYGRVYNVKTRNFLKPKKGDRKGHLCVCVRNAAGEKKYPYVHHMMAEAFVENHRGDPIVRHLDDDPNNNSGEHQRYRSIIDACRCLGIQPANASKVLNGTRQHTCGYFFEYAED